MKAFQTYAFALGALVAFTFAAPASAQSSTQDFPTPVTSSEVAGTIKPRDLGDSRLTTYYFALAAEQGDLFVNLVTRNFSGDIDLFTVSGLRPLTKIVVYADYSEAETGRAVYLRKPERLLLRVQGRTPNDDPATFRLKFAGSFAALRPEDVPSAPELPKIASVDQGSVRVNSAGTILPSPRVTASSEERLETVDPPAETTAEAKSEPAPEAKDEEPKPTVIVSDPIRPKIVTAVPSASRRSTAARRRTPPPVELVDKVDKKAEEPVADPTAETAPPTEAPAAETAAARKVPTKPEPGFRTLTDRRRTPPKKAEAPAPDPLESINLVIRFKDGNSLEKKMSEVFRFSVDKGILTVVLKDGSISRYPIIEVARVTIE